jgi:hypothetical protein
MAYRVGFSQGLIANADIDWQQLPMPSYAHGYMFPHFGFLGVLMGLFIFALAVGMLRRIFFFPHWRYCSPYGPRHPMSRKEWRYWHHPFWGAWPVDDDEPADETDEEEPKKK